MSFIKEKWVVERNNGIRQIVTDVTRKLIITNLDKGLAFYISELHNEKLNRFAKKLIKKKQAYNDNYRSEDER